MMRENIVKVSNILKVHYGKSLKATERESRGSIPVYGSSGFVGFHTEGFVQHPTIIIGRKGSVGAVTYAPDGGWPIDTTFFIEPIKPDSIDLRYIFYALQQAKLDRHTITTSIPGLNRNDIYKTEIVLPPLAEQKRIARILDVAAAVQAQRRATLTHLDTLLQSTFLHMFGDPVTNPMHWEEVSLSELTDIVSGVTKGRNFAGKETVMVPYMRVANVQDGELALADVKTIEVLPSDVEKYRLQKGDILLTEGGDPDKLGRGAIWEDQISSCIHQNHIFRVRVDHHRALPEYLSALIGSKRGKVYFLRAAKQTTGIATINQTQLKAFSVLLPPLILQRQYSEFVHQIKTTKSKLLQHGNHLDVLFASLQQRAFRGELSPG